MNIKLQDCVLYFEKILFIASIKPKQLKCGVAKGQNTFQILNAIILLSTNQH